jgi:putative glutamine amidotransferase
MKPVVGITPSPSVDTLAHGTFQRSCITTSYHLAIEAAGGVPIILPPQGDGVDTIIEILDGLLLSGGADIDPSRYGDQDVHPATYGIDPERDRFEFELFDAALRRGIPVFGVCRGFQVINVALGGTLIQDVAEQHPGAAEIGHRQHQRGLSAADVGHEVLATERNLLPIFNDGRLGVNSYHHQAIRDLAPVLIPIAYSPDGLIEAVSMRDNEHVFAVQWHPELMFERDAAHLRPFRLLVEAAAARKLTATII